MSEASPEERAEERAEDPSQDPLHRWEKPLLVLILAVAALLLLRPVLGDPLGLAVGAQRSEAPRHLWGLWATAAKLGEWGPFVAQLNIDHPSGYTRHLMDPVNLLFFLPGYLVAGGGATGATLGWNLVHAAWPVIGGVGGWLLARELLPEGTGATPRLVAALACATAPYLMATPWLGRSEMLPGALLSLHLWLLVRALRRDGWGWSLGAGLSLAGIALGGWYLAAWMALLEPILALFIAWRWGRGGWPARLGRLAVIAVVAVIPVVPALWALLEHPPPVMGEDHALGPRMGISTPPWMLLPFSGSQGLPGTDLPAYPGTVLSMLAAWGALTRKKARPWLIFGAGLLVLSLGPWLVWSVDASELEDALPLPAYFLEALLPPLRGIWGWSRISILVTPALAVAAAFGVADLLPRLRQVRVQALVLVLVGILVDHGRSRAPAGVMGSSFSVQPPPELVEALNELPEGALLQLPFDDLYISWQLAHGRPIAESQEIEDVRELSWTVQQALRLMAVDKRGEAPPEELRGARPEGCLRKDGARLHELGFSAIILHKNRLPDQHQQLSRFLSVGLGPPVVDGPRLAAWTLPTEAPSQSYDCPLADVQPVVGGAGPQRPTPGPRTDVSPELE